MTLKFINDFNNTYLFSANFILIENTSINNQTFSEKVIPISSSFESSKIWLFAKGYSENVFCEFKFTLLIFTHIFHIQPFY